MTDQQQRKGKLRPDEAAAWRGMLRVQAHVVGRQNEAVQRQSGLTITEWEVLRALEGAPERRRRIGELTDLVLLTQAGVTRLVSRLEDRGLVERVPHPHDRRGTVVGLTGAGRAAFARARPQDVLAYLFLDRLTPEQLRRLADTWEAVLPGAATLDDDTWAQRRR